MRLWKRTDVSGVSNHMLIAIRFKNFLSFKGEAELSLVAHAADKTLSSSLINVAVSKRKKIDLLPVIAIYGANSAGKTNVLRTITYMKDAVVNSQSKWKPRGNTKFQTFADQNPFKDSGSIEIDFFISDIRYTYGLSATRTHFVEEWLRSYPLGRERELFSRAMHVPPEYDEFQDSGEVRAEAQFNFSDNFPGDKSYLETIVKKVRHNSLFLSAAAQDNHPLCREIYNWFDEIEVENISSARDRTNAMVAAGRMAEDSGTKDAILRIMRAADPNLSDIIVRKTEFNSDVPSFVEELGEENKRRFLEDFKYSVYFVTKNGDGTITLPFEAQSRGFQKLFALSSRVIDALKSGTSMFIDELETSIHPHLARFIVDLFQNKEVNTGRSQLIFTTHDTNMLDQSLLRRDQIWFVERKGCCSELYSLLEFSPRKDENLERGYLRGRYGAIPALGMDADWLEAGHQEATEGMR